MRIFTVSLLMITGLSLTLVFGKKWTIYVDHAISNPQANCGRVHTPCKEINEYVLKQIETSKLDVMVKIKYARSAKKTFSYNVERTLLTNNNITIKQWGQQRPVIITPNQYFFKLTDKENRTASLVQQRITLSGLILHGSLFELERSNTQINIISCNVTNPKDYLLKSTQEEITVKVFIDDITCFNCYGVAWFKSLQDKSVLLVNASHFVSDTKSKDKHRGIIIENAPNAITLIMRYSVFENLKISLELQMNRECSKLSASVTVDNCAVRGSVQPVNISGCFAANIRRSYFDSNNGGALFLDKAKVAILNNNTFANNKGNGAVRMRNIRDFVLVNNTVFINNTQIKDGGAIYVSDSHLIIKLSSFENNAAKYAGGAIYHFAKTCAVCEVKLENVSLSTSIEEFSEKGTLLYSNRLAVFVNVTGKMRHSSANNDHTSISVMESDYSMVLLYNVNSSFRFECPMHFIPSVSLTTPDVTEDGDTNMIYGVEKIHCNVCPKSKYNTKPVIMRSPTPNTQGSCNRCPHGANCTKGIQSQDDFWGYEKSGKIEFIACPFSYCCSKSTTQCAGISTCSANREGLLCGSCKKNYTLSFYSNDCVNKETCNQWVLRISLIIWLLASVYFFSSDRRFISIFRAINKLNQQCQGTSPKSLSVQFVESGIQGQVNTGMESNAQPANENISSLLDLKDETCCVSQVIIDAVGSVRDLQTYSDLLPSMQQETSHSKNALIDMGETNPFDFSGPQESLRNNNFSDSEEVLFNAADQILGKIDNGDRTSSVVPESDFKINNIVNTAQETTGTFKDNISDGIDFSIGYGGEMQNNASDISRSHLRRKSYHFSKEEFQVENSNDLWTSEEKTDNSTLKSTCTYMKSSPVEENEVFETIDLKSDYKTNAHGAKKNNFCIDSPSPTTSVSDSKNKETQSNSSNGDVPMINIVSSKASPNDFSSNKSDVELVILSTGLLQLVSLYYQCLPIVTSHMSNNRYGFIGDMFNFQLSIYKSCPLTESSLGLNIWIKIVYLMLHPMVPALICLCKAFYNFCKGKDNVHYLRMTKTAIDLLVLIYIPMTNLALSMVTCININGKSRYYFNGNSQCYTKLQWLMILFIVYWIAPLPLALYGACKMVQKHLIPMKQFYTILLCPWFCIYSYLIVRKRRFQKLELTENEVQDMSIILKGVFGPFHKSNDEDLEVSFNGQSVNLARGFLLALTIPMVGSSHGIRLLLTIVILIASISHQCWYKPYTTKTLNRFALGLLGTLLLVNAINLMEAFKYMYAMENSQIFFTMAFVLSIVQIAITLLPGAIMILLFTVSLFRDIQTYINIMITRCYTGKPYELHSKTGIETISGEKSKPESALKSGNELIEVQ